MAQLGVTQLDWTNIQYSIATKDTDFVTAPINLTLRDTT